MPSATEYRQRVANMLGVFPLANSASAYPSSQASGGRVGFANGKIDDVVSDLAAEILALIAANPANPRRRDLETTATVTSGQLLPVHAGPLGEVLVEGKPGVRTSADDITRLLANQLGLPTTGYYALRGDRIYYVGITATVDLVVITAPVDPASVPAEYAEALVCMAVAELLMFAGDQEAVPAAQTFFTIAKEMRAAITAAAPVPVAPEVLGV